MSAAAGTDLDTCVDADTMRAWLARTLPECAAGRSVLEGVRVAQARRNASRQRNPHPLTLVYELALRDAATGRADTTRLLAKVYRDGASADDAAPGTLHLPALDMRLWRWPLDPGLPQLQALLDPACATPWWGAPAEDACALRHEPEERATLRYTRRAGTEALYAKTFRDTRAQALQRRFAHFWALGRRDPKAPRVAETLGLGDDGRTLWQAQAAGQPLIDALAADPPRQDRARRKLAVCLAQALAALHAAPAALAGEARRDTAHWSTEVARRARKIGRAVPPAATRAQAVADALIRVAPAHAPGALSLIHGDWHPGQVALDGERVVLFDFDEFALGDPMEDLAQFVTKLGALRGAAALATDLLAAYAQAAPGRFHAPRLRWHLALQQLLQASRAFVFQRPGWRGALHEHLSRAETLARGAGAEVAA